MASSSGSIYAQKKNSYVVLEWSVSSRNIANNTTTLYWRAGVYVTNGNKWYSNAVKIYSAYINGTYVFGGGTYSSLTSNGYYWKGDGYITVPHNDNGQKGFSASISGWFYGYGDTSNSGYWDLETIPRASGVTCPATFTAGTAGTITLDRKVSSFTHTASNSLGDTGMSATSDIATSFTYTPPISLFNSSTYASETSRDGTITVHTKSGTTNIGSAVTKSFTVNLPENESTKPTCSLGNTLTEYGSSYLSRYGVLIEDKSKLQMSSSASAKVSATVAEHNFTIPGSSATRASNGTVTTDYLKVASGNSTFSYYVKDSRGFTSTTATVANPYRVVSYRAPFISSFEVIRVKSDGTVDPVNGDKLKFVVNYYVDPVAVSNSYQPNTATVKIYKLEKDSSGIVTGRTLLTTSSGGTLNVANGVVTSIVNGTYPVSSTFSFEATIVDEITTTEQALNRGTQTSALTAKALMSFYQGDGITFGRIAENDGFNVSMKASFEDRTYVAVDEDFKASCDIVFPNLVDTTYPDSLPEIAVDAGIQNFINLLYPIGHILENTTSSFNPNTTYPWQTWERYGNGRVTVGVNESDSTMNSAGKTLGSSTHSHKYGLQYNAYYGDLGIENNTNAGLLNYSSANVIGLSTQTTYGSNTTATFNGNNSASSKSVSSAAYRHIAQNEYVSTIQPSITVYRWRRTA